MIKKFVAAVCSALFLLLANASVSSASAMQGSSIPSLAANDTHVETKLPIASTDINGGWVMYNNNSVASPDGRTELRMVRGLLEVWVDGDHAWTAAQSSAGSYVTFQKDGNLVVYDLSGPVWSSNTGLDCTGRGCHLSIQNDGNVVIEGDVVPIDYWDTDTAR